MPRASIFSYPITRQYPSHYTWIILGGGAVVITLFTFLSIAQNGLYFESKVTLDPNGTEACKHWFQKAPFTWTADLDTKCEPSLLNIGDSLTTSNRGFRYTIDSFMPEGNSSNVLAYRNSSLSECQVKQIEIELLRRDNTRLPNNGNAWTWGATYAHSMTECLMYTDDGYFRVNLTSALRPVLDYARINDDFGALNDSHPGRYLGARFVSGWYAKLPLAMSWSVPLTDDLHDSSKPAWGSGRIILTRSNRTDDFEDLNFFGCYASFPQSQGGASTLGDSARLDSRTMDDWYRQWDNYTEKDKGPQMPNISVVVDTFSKTYYSLLLSDFNSTDEVRRTNALMTSKGLQWLDSRESEETTQDARTLWPRVYNETTSPQGKISFSLDGQPWNLTQPLADMSYTTLVTQYICSAPQEKDGFKLFYAVLIADLVFLNSFWKLFGLVATWWLGRTDESSEYCKACVKAGQDIPLASTPGPAGSGAYSQVSSEVGEER